MFNIRIPAIIGSLRGRLVIMVMLVALPGLLLLTLHALAEREQAIEVARQQAVGTVRQLSDTQTRLIRETRDFLVRLARMPEVQDPTSPACSAALSRALQLTRQFVNLGVPGADGELRCNAFPLDKPVNVADRPYIRQALDERSFSIGRYQLDRAAGVSSVNFAYPIIHASLGDVIGAAVAVISLDWWSRNLFEASLPEGAFAYITDSENQIIAIHPQNPAMLGQPESALGLHLLESEQRGDISVHVAHQPNDLNGGKSRMLASMALVTAANGKPASISVGIPYTARITRIEQDFVRTIALVVAGLGVVILVAYWGVNVSVVEPISQMVTDLGRLEQGEYPEQGVNRGAQELIELQRIVERTAKTRLDTEAQLQESQARFDQIAQNILDVFWIIDPDSGRISYLSPGFQRIWGLPPEAVLDSENGQFPEVFEEDRQLARIDPEALGNAGHRAEFRIRDADGRPRWIRIHAFPVIDDRHQLSRIVGIASDITESREQADRIVHQAYFDSLTDLPNRSLVNDRLDQAIREARRYNRRVGVLFLDLDDFKKVNDSLGHTVGDQVLVEAATRLQAICRASDTVGRLGGDEFVVILGNLQDSLGILPVARKILGRFKQPFQIESLSLPITSSIGVAIYPRDGNTPAELLRCADSAMYNAKESGRNTYSFYSAEMNDRLSRRLLLEGRLHGALERGELSVHYQPQISLDNRLPTGVEALIRWHSEELGQVSPAEFIPIAEQTGLIVPIGEFVLHEAIAAVSGWHRQGHTDFTVGINLSPRQFLEAGLIPVIRQAIGLHGVPPSAINFEITEGVLMSEQDSVKDALTAIREMGFGISLDDFGTGYASLSYLRSFPFTKLKIDKSFVDELADRSTTQSLVRSIINMAHDIGQEVIAEGVETEAQAAMLSKLNCNIGQGFLYSKAVSREHIDALLDEINGDETAA